MKKKTSLDVYSSIGGIQHEMIMDVIRSMKGLEVEEEEYVSTHGKKCKKLVFENLKDYYNMCLHTKEEIFEMWEKINKEKGTKNK